MREEQLIELSKLLNISIDLNADNSALLEEHKDLVEEIKESLKIKDFIRQKEQKKRYLKKEKRKQREQGIKVGEYTYFSTPLDLQKYEHAMKTGKRIASKQGIEWTVFTGMIKVQEGLVEIDGQAFDEALEAIDVFLYRTWYKEQMINSAIDACSTLDELDAIEWGQ